MCCKIDLNSQKDAAHFLGKTDPNLLPKTHDNVPNGKVQYSKEPALSLFDRILAYFSKHSQA